MNKKTIFIILILGIAVLAVLVVIGIYPRKPVTPPVEGPSVPTEVETTTPAEPSTEEITTAPTEEVVESTETSKFSSCVVLDEEYCDKGEPIYHEGEFSLIGFILPKGVKIYAPAEGLYGEGSWGSAETISVYVPPFENGLMFDFYGAEPISREEMRATIEDYQKNPEKYGAIGSEPPTRRKLKKGELFGRVKGEIIDTGNIFNENRKYTLIIGVSRANWCSEGEAVPEPSALQEYFPYIK